MKYLSQIEDPKNKTKNEAILSDRMEKFNAIPGYRVGDYLKLPFLHKKLGTLTRITHLWDATAQTGGRSGSSFYLGHGGLSYSGGLDSGVKREDILPEPLPEAYYKGNVWFFDEDMAGAGRGITCSVPMRVFALREGADVSGVGECQCPYFLSAYAEPEKQHQGYLYGITKQGIQETAFRSVIELREWLAANDLDQTADLIPGRGQRLAYV